MPKECEIKECFRCGQRLYHESEFDAVVRLLRFARNPLEGMSPREAYAAIKKWEAEVDARFPKRDR